MPTRQVMTPAPKASITLAAAIALYACLTASAQADARQIVLYDGFGANRFLLEGRVIEADGDQILVPCSSPDK